MIEANDEAWGIKLPPKSWILNANEKLTDSTHTHDPSYLSEHQKDLIPAFKSGGKVIMPIVFFDDYADDFSVLDGRHRIAFGFLVSLKMLIIY